MSEDWNSLLKDLVVGVCAIFIIASALAGATSYLLLRLMFPMPGDHFEQTGPEGSAGLDGTPIAME